MMLSFAKKVCFCRWYYSLVKVSPAVMEEVKRIVTKSEVIEEDDSQWPEPDSIGRQELEILIDNKHIFFTVCFFHLFSLVLNH